MLLSDAARDRGGLGGGVLPMCERMLREFMLWRGHERANATIALSLPEQGTQTMVWLGRGSESEGPVRCTQGG
jgi:hypothetical protein